MPEARPPWRSPRARRQRTERFLIYTLQRHEHVQRGSVPQLWWSSVSLAASDRTDAAMAKPENAVCLRRRTWRPNFRECLARLSDKKPASIARSASAASSILAAPSSPSRQRRGLSGRSHLSAKQMPKKRTRADSLMRENISPIARFNSLQGLKKFPVRMRRELARKALS